MERVKKKKIVKGKKKNRDHNNNNNNNKFRIGRGRLQPSGGPQGNGRGARDKRLFVRTKNTHTGINAGASRP